jgi:hypothetical protein
VIREQERQLRLWFQLTASQHGQTELVWAIREGGEGLLVALASLPFCVGLSFQICTM